MNVINNECTVCPYCGSAHVNKIDSMLSYCMSCGNQIITIMRKSNISEEDSLNKKKKADDMVACADCELQQAYASMKLNIAEGYENIEASTSFDMINE